ncbi:GTP-binding protein [Tieghemostelium lacteum]|uniref:Translation factor GUF1 homolog, mitochondrial n=1 Tax=Tieghemostelium lacteum TaxID=361077 RepID=A0A151Z6W9_TIELA|nr:GTP-binding protein [Tieghemostelium lacteum]|eukprot:KYQ89677.1 GTP-binding protein [Tieghemostelium lacteum]
MKKNLVSNSKSESIHKFYDIQNQIGIGKFSVVKSAVEKSTNKQWAIKIMKKSVVEEQNILKEIEIMNDAKHANVIFLHEVFETEYEILLVLELVTGGELFDKIVEKSSYTEEDASLLVLTLTKVIQFLHSKDIVHCDLKPENLLYSDSSDSAVIKLCDFGLSQRCPSGTKLKSLVGTLSYMAPEISACTGYGKPVDMWSLGVIIYILLCGFPPFDESTGYVLEFPSPEWDNISDSAKGLIKSLLTLDPLKRLTAEQTLRHPWVCGQSTGKQSIIGTLKTLREFNTLRRSGTMGPMKQTRGTVFELFPSLANGQLPNQPGSRFSFGSSIPIKPSPSMDSIPKIIDPTSILKISNELKLSSSNILVNANNSNTNGNSNNSSNTSENSNSTICNIVSNNNSNSINNGNNNGSSSINSNGGANRSRLNSISEESSLKKQLINSLDAHDSSSETSSTSSPNNTLMINVDKLNSSPELALDLGGASSDGYYQQKIGALVMEKLQLQKELDELRKENQTLRGSSSGSSLSSTPNGHSPFLSSSYESKSKLILHIRTDSSGSAYSSDSESTPLGKKDKSKYGVERIVSDLLSDIDKLYLSKETMEKLTNTFNNYKSKNQEKSLKHQYEKQKEKYKKLKIIFQRNENFKCFNLNRYYCSNNNSTVPVDISSYPPERIRNFSIIAHIDHGKTTLSTKLLSLTGTLPKNIYGSGEESLEQREKNENRREQYLDKLQVEKERGITVKAQTCSMIYKNAKDQKQYLLNLIDTPGHVDFNYEVTRSLMACQGALLVIDACQGVQAQTMANYYLALESGLEVIPVINKIDLPTANVERVKEELRSVFGFHPDDAILVSAKTGVGIKDILPAVIDRIPPPTASLNKPFKGLLFDSWFDRFRGVICLVNVRDGVVKKGDMIVSAGSQQTYEVFDIGIMHPEQKSTGALYPGQVGYVTPGMKTSKEARVGDTFFKKDHPVEALPGFKPARQMVFAGVYPVDSEDYADLKESFEKLQLTDSSISTSNERSVALGMGFRCGFLGLLHMDVVLQRLEQEYGQVVIATPPTVPYKVIRTDGTEETISNPAEYPASEYVEKTLEPMITAQIVTPNDYFGGISKLAIDSRGIQLDHESLENGRSRLTYQFPLSEIITDFYDNLKRISSGYANLDYEDAGYQESDVVKVKVMLNGEEVDSLSSIVHRSRATTHSRKLVKRLKGVIERQMFVVAIQAAVGNDIMARETISAMRKDVTAKCYGGDITRRRKLLDKQKEGKKRMKKMGCVELSQEGFLKLMKNEGIDD